MMASDDNEPAKLTEDMRAEINPESIDDIVKPIGYSFPRNCLKRIRRNSFNYNF